jgi:hypothetical protein
MKTPTLPPPAKSRNPFAYRPAAPRPWSPPRMGANIITEIKERLPELKEAGNFFLVTGAFAASDLILHQVFPNIEGKKTPPTYYGNKLIWTIPALLAGRIVSDYVVKGSNLARAFTIGTVANLLLGIRYITGSPVDQTLTYLAIHEALLVPLSLLITGPSGATGTAPSPSGY